MKNLLARIDKVFFWSLWSVALMIVYYGYLQARIDAQVQDNRFIAAEISKVDRVLGELKELQTVKRSVLERVQIVQELTFSNAGHAAILGELTDIDPAISLHSIEFEPGSLLLKGRFTSQAAIVAFAQKLDDFSYDRESGKTRTYNLDYNIDNDRFSLEMKIDGASK